MSRAALRWVVTLEGPKPSASSVSRKTLQVPTWRGWAAGRPGGQGGAQLQRHSPLRKANTVHGRTLAEYAECWHRRATDRAGRRTLEWTEFPHSVFPAFTQVPTGRGSPAATHSRAWCSAPRTLNLSISVQEALVQSLSLAPPSPRSRALRAHVRPVSGVRWPPAGSGQTCSPEGW